MAIDPYTPCPGGTGKKIKFCCADLISELDKIQRMLDGDQRVACLDYVHKVSQKHPGRACLLAVQSDLETSLGKEEEAAKTLAEFGEKYPDNPIGLARAASLKVSEGDIGGAIDALLHALELCKEDLPSAVYHTISTVALEALGSGHILAARALLELQVGISRGEDQQSLAALGMLHSGRGLHLLLKESRDLAAPPESAPWRFEFDVAFQRALHEQWRPAAIKFTALIPLAGNAPELWNNLAVLRGRLADDAGAAEALHKLATLDIPLDDAVEAEALATLLEKIPPEDAERELLIHYRVVDQAAIEERFAASRELDRLPFDPRSEQPPEGDAPPEPPPRAVFALLSKPLTTGEGAISADSIPEMFAVAYLYGRQTDRPEHLRLQVHETELAAAEALLARIAGDTLGPRKRIPNKWSPRAARSIERSPGARGCPRSCRNRIGCEPSTKNGAPESSSSCQSCRSSNSEIARSKNLPSCPAHGFAPWRSS